MSAVDTSSLSPAQLEALLNQPALVSPDGIYNFIDPPNDNLTFYAALFTCLAVACALFLIRTYSRLFCVKVVRIEDYLGVIAFGFYLGYVYCCYRMTEVHGGYVHQWNYRMKDMPEFIRSGFLATTFLFASLLFLKAAILLEWMHIFASHTRNLFFWTCQFLLWIHILFNFSIIVAFNAKCKPYEKNWNSLLPGTCVDYKPIDVASAIFNLVADVLIFILPQKVIWSLRMSLNRKIGLSIVFTMGVLTCMCGAFRLYWTFVYQNSPDATYNLCPFALWCLAEVTVGFLVFCMPATPKALATLSPLFSSVKSWVNSSTRRLKEIPSSAANTDSFPQRPKSNVYQEIDEVNLIPLASTGTLKTGSKEPSEHVYADEAQNRPISEK
ncbi:hypothetical protein F5Y13DRAFT_162195 [Hypoxylon sp. FL1857]|nr:hypothetical protein F5Y13DRAFT_162195 [Hypoxylon sp. FL1857]